MSTLELHAAHAPKSWTLFGGFTRAASAVFMVLDAFSEAQRQAHEAQKRYPFAIE